MAHYLPPPPPHGASWSDPASVPAILCSTPPLERPWGVRAGWTRDPAAVTCQLCKLHPRFPRHLLPERTYTVRCVVCGATATRPVPRKGGRRRLTCSPECGAVHRKRTRKRASVAGLAA